MLKPKVLALLLVAIFSIGVLTSCAQTSEDSDTVALSDSLSAVTGDDDSSDADSELTTSDESSTMTTTTKRTTTTTTTTKKASSTTTTTKKPETTTTKRTTTTTAKPTTTTTKYNPPPATTTQYSPPVTTTTPYEPPETTPTTTAPPETTTTTTTTTPAPPAYDDQMAQALRQAGEDEFYSIVEYAEMYHWRVENVRIIRETDTQFGICGRFFEPFSTEPDIYSNICIKAYLSSGAIQCSDWIIPVTGPDESNYDSYDYYMSRDSLLEAIRGGGYLDN